MTLTRHDGVEEYQGSGIVEQKKDGSISFVLASAECAVSVVDYCNRTLKSKGEGFISESYYYSLWFEDIQGRQWCSTPTIEVYPSFAAGGGVAVDGKLNEITSKMQNSRPVKKSHAVLHFNRKFKYPANKARKKATWVEGEKYYPGSSMDTADVSSPRYNFRLTLDADNNQLIQITSKRPRKHWEKHLESRVCDALELVTGQTIRWFLAVFQYNNVTEIRLRSIVLFGDGKTNRPIHERRQADTWKLFSLYLESLCKGALNDSVGKRLRIMRRPIYWDGKLLAAGTQVEGMMTDWYDKRVQPPQEIKGLVDRLFKAIKKDEAPDVAKNRVMGALGLVKSRSSAENKLKKLAEENVITGSYIDAWRHIRNKSAHADLNATDISDANLIFYNRVLVIFYQLIFDLVGYEGKYVDYGAVDHCQKCYPLSGPQSKGENK